MRFNSNQQGHNSSLPGLLITALLCAATLLGASSFKAASPRNPSTSPLALGNYPDTSVVLSANATITPDAAPTNTTSINVSTSTSFHGALEADPGTGVLRVTDARPAGTYLVTVRAFNGSSLTATTTFTLTVTTPVACPVVTFASAANFFTQGEGPWGTAVGDFNRDGKQDLAAANVLSNNVSIFLGNGAGNFSSPTTFVTGITPRNVAVGDFNGDGKQDLAVASGSSNAVSILLGDGTGHFGAATNFSTAPNPLFVAVGDFNGDGKQDLVTANYDSNNVSLLLGDGAGHFSAAVNFAAGTEPFSVAVGDFNRDDKQDLAVADRASDSVLIFLGDGTGNFSAAINFSASVQPWSIAVGDFNNDDKQDLAVANGSFDCHGNVSILLGDGAGNFGSPTNFQAYHGPDSIAVGDFNGDGDQDLVVGNACKGPPTLVSILLGNGDGQFAAPIHFGADFHPLSVTTGDFNGDGLQDVAVGNFISNTVSVLLRTCTSTSPTPSPSQTPTPSATATATATGTPTPTLTPCSGSVVWSENFDKLPAGTIGPCFYVSNIDPDTSPNDLFQPDPDGIIDCAYGLTPLTIPNATSILRFRNNFNTEFSNGVYWDGGVLEVSTPNISGGDFLDITDSNVGGSFISGGYTGEISGLAGNPLAGRMAWSGNSGGYTDTIINLGPNLIGQTATFRFRFGSDEAVGAPGWRIDTIEIIEITNGGCTPTPSPTPISTPTPSPTPVQPRNLSTRMLVQTGDQVGIGGFIITGGADPKQVLLRAIGPSLGSFGVPNPLADPVMELHGPDGFTTITNDNWRDTQMAAIKATGLAPTDDLESAILVTLDPGAYTAIVKGKDNTSGVGLVEIYDLGPATSQLANISTRAFVSTSIDILIAGFILSNNSDHDSIILRGIGPSLTGFGVSNALSDPTLELRNNQGVLLFANNDWHDDPTQAALVSAAGLGPSDPLESAIAATLLPGQYTALLAGRNSSTGVGLVEVYSLGSEAPTPTPTPSATPTPSSSPSITPCGGSNLPCSTPTATPTAISTPCGGPNLPCGCVENFDGVTAPSLPSGWTASNPIPGDGTMWVTSTTMPDTAPNAAFIGDQDGISDKVLDTTPFMVGPSASISFRNNFNTEFSGGIYWDGFVLEVSTPNISGGDFLDITDPLVGGSFTSGGYTGQIDGTAGNPLAGRMAWSGDSAGYIDTQVNLGPNLAGQMVRSRFRMGTDIKIATPGVHIDSVVFVNTTCPP